MKKHYSLLLLIGLSLTSFAQNKLSKLESSETSIIFSTFPVVNINNFQDNTNSAYSFLQAYKLISENDQQTRFQSLASLQEQTKSNSQDHSVPLAILNTHYEVLQEDALSNGKIHLDTGGFAIQNNNSQNIFSKKSISLLAPLQIKHKGLNATFRLTDDSIFSNFDKDISSISIDFGDDNGFIDVSKNEDLVIKYSDKGSKVLTTIMNFSDGSSTTSKSTIEIKYSNEDLMNLFNRMPTTFTSSNTTAPNLTPYGIADDIGTGEYEIFLSADNILDKPIFLVDGFDPGDGRDIIGMYELLNFDDQGMPSNLADIVRAEGYDVVILNFPVYTRASDNEIIDGGADFIERNAMLLVELVGIINAQKVGSEDNVIIGPSMGGLISRYALNFMENQNIDHETRLWLSFDSPHHGANVPIGFQYLFNKMAYGLQLGGLAGDQSVVAVRPLVDDFLQSPAARQMLTDHFDAHITSGTDFDNALKLPQKHPWNILFFDGLNDLTPSGFPESTRNVSIANGSGIGSPYQDTDSMDILPDFLALNVDNLQIGSGLASADADFTSRFTPLSGQENITGSIDIDAPFLCFCDFSVSTTVMAESFTDGIDAAPGGLFDISGITGDIPADPLVDAFFLGLNTDKFNFIPTISSMALETNNGELNWYHSIDLGEGTPPNSDVLNETPFVNWFMPDDNEPHVQLTEANVDFALDEIILETLTNETFEASTFKIEKNPIVNELTILSSHTYDRAKVRITDLTGKVVSKKIITINNKTLIPINVASGMYVLNIETDREVFQSKIIVQ